MLAASLQFGHELLGPEFNRIAEIQFMRLLRCFVLCYKDDKLIADLFCRLENITPPQLRRVAWSESHETIHFFCTNAVVNNMQWNDGYARRFLMYTMHIVHRPNEELVAFESERQRAVRFPLHALRIRTQRPSQIHLLSPN